MLKSHSKEKNRRDYNEKANVDFSGNSSNGNEFNHRMFTVGKQEADTQAAAKAEAGTTAGEETAKAGESQEETKAAAKTYDSPELILRYAEVNAEKDERAQASMQFADLIKEKTNGRIEIQVFPGAQLGDNKQVFQNLQLGAIDMTNSVPAQYKTMGLDIPYVKVLEFHFCSGMRSTR